MTRRWDCWGRGEMDRGQGRRTTAGTGPGEDSVRHREMGRSVRREVAAEGPPVGSTRQTTMPWIVPRTLFLLCYRSCGLGAHEWTGAGGVGRRLLGDPTRRIVVSHRCTLSDEQAVEDKGGERVSV